MLSPIQSTQNVLPLPILSVSAEVNPPASFVSQQSDLSEVNHVPETSPLPEDSIPWLLSVQELLTELVSRNAELRCVTVTEDEYAHLSSIIDELTWSVGDDEKHPLAATEACVGDFMRNYEDKNFPTMRELWPELREQDAIIQEILERTGANKRDIYVPTEEEVAIDAFFDLGGFLWEKGLGEQAISAYDTAIRLKPDYAAAYCNRGSIHYALGNHAAAIQDYNEAIRLQPERVEGYFNRAVTKFQLQDYADAIRDYDEVLARKADYADAYVGRAHAKFAMHQYVEATRDYDEALRLTSDDAVCSYRDTAQARAKNRDLPTSATN